jgi:hypothetical protein
MALHYLPEWSPIPIRTLDGNKVPMVKGVSGHAGRYVSRSDVLEWVARPRLAAAQIGIRLPKDVVGLDVDRYAGKAGGRTIAALQSKWGKLDLTWSSTSRTDGSGIHLYRLPAGVSAAPFRDPKGTFSDGTEVGGLDIVRYCHRFVTCYPTFHGRDGGRTHQYLWFNPDGEADDEEQEWPLPNDLPFLPEGWCVGLATGREYAAGDTKLSGKASDWLKARPSGDGPLCEIMERDLNRYLKEVQQGGEAGGCYPAANRGLLAIVGNAAEGHAGGFLAMKRLWTAYRTTMGQRKSDRRSPDALSREFENSLRGAIEHLPSNKYRDEDLCDWELA